MAFSVRKVLRKGSKRDKSSKTVRFKDTVLVYFLPALHFKEQWLARFGVWKEAPFHDVLWDGYAEKFRPKPLTKRQLAKANKEYKWRRRLPPKLYRIMFEKGSKKPKKRLSKARDEVILYEERMQKIEDANRKLAEDIVQERANSKAKARHISSSKKKLDPAVTKDINDSEPDLISVFDSDGEHQVERVPRRHKLQDLLQESNTKIKSVASIHNPSLRREKSQVLTAYDKYEHEIERRRESFQSGAAQDPDNLSTVSFEMDINGEHVTVTVPKRNESDKNRDSTRVSELEVDTDSEQEVAKPNEATFGNIVWALGQAVSSYFFTPIPEAKKPIEEEEEDDDTIDNMSAIEAEAAREVKRQVQNVLNASSISLKTETRQEIIDYLDEFPEEKSEAKGAVKDI